MIGTAIRRAVLLSAATSTAAALATFAAPQMGAAFLAGLVLGLLGTEVSRG